MKRSTPTGGGRPPSPPPPLTREQEGWVERGMQVVAKCARKHARRQSHLASYEELLSLGSIGLMQAVRTYRPDSGKDFEIYCYKRIDGAMRYGMKKEGKFYALLWDAAYTHLETTRDEGPSLEEDGAGDERALHGFSDRLVTAMARKLCGSATMMEAATSEDALARREAWSRRMRIFVEELERTPEEGREILRLVYDDGMDVKAAGKTLGLNYGQVRRLCERTIDDLGARVRRRCTFDKIE